MKLKFKLKNVSTKEQAEKVVSDFKTIFSAYMNDLEPSSKKIRVIGGYVTKSDQDNSYLFTIDSPNMVNSIENTRNIEEFAEVYSYESSSDYDISLLRVISDEFRS